MDSQTIRCAARLGLQLERLQQLRERVAEKFDITSNSHQVGRRAGLHAPSRRKDGVLAIALSRRHGGGTATGGSCLPGPHRGWGHMNLLK